MPQKSQNVESCQDFMGTEMRVGDFIARSINGEMVMSEITRIRYKQTKKYVLNLNGRGSSGFVNQEQFIVCQILTKSMGKLVEGIVRPENVVFVDKERAMLYKLLKG